MNFNDFAPIRETLEVVMARHDASTTRYKGIIFSTESQHSLNQLVHVVQQEFAGYNFWLDNTNANTPNPPVSRRIFIQKVFDESHPGLVVISPEEWMFDWTLLDKRSFWAALSEAYGRHNVITVVAETFEIKKIVSDYFIPQNLHSSPFHIWTSKFEKRNLYD